MSQSFDMPPGLQPKAQQEMNRWLTEQQALLSELLSEPLRILVWGPGNVVTDAPGQERKKAVVLKRIQIRDELINAGHAATFSEHWPTTQPNVSIKLWEYTQAQTAHLIILLIEESPGGQGEMHDFSVYEELVRKLLVMFPLRYQTNYSALSVGRLLDLAYGSVYWYADNEIEDCQVLAQALKRAAALRETAALRKMVGGVQ